MKYVKVKEAAKLLRVTETTVYKKIKQGGIKVKSETIGLSNKLTYRIPMSEIEKFKKKQPLT